VFNDGPNTGGLAFFFEFKRRVGQQFSGLFGQADSDGNNDDYTPSGLARWGWFHILESISGNDITKHEAVLAQPITAIFTHLSYMRDFNSEQIRIMKQRK
jgi:hypothetical protein